MRIALRISDYGDELALIDRRFAAASVVDPFGNVLGIMFNPHYVATLKALGKA